MVDAHCHLYESREIEVGIEKFREAGGRVIVCCGDNLEASQKSIELAEKYPEVYATVGLHPGESTNFQIPRSKQKLKSKLIKLTNNKKVVGIGECGLDFKTGISDEEKASQMGLFKFNIGLAKEAGLPLTVHCRNAFSEVYDLIKESGLKIQMHCWTGDEYWLRKFIEIGCYISFGGIVTFKAGNNLRELIKKVPEDKILTETDAPYLSPEPVRGTVNEPANVRWVVKCIADTMGKPESYVAKLTRENIKELWGIEI